MKVNKLKNELLKRTEIPVGYFNIFLNLSVRNILNVRMENHYPLKFINRFFTNTYALGPLQRDEALFIYSTIKMIRPKNVVEFGFNNGNSTYCILMALDNDAKLFSYDISDSSAYIARHYFEKHFKNFKFLKKGQETFSPKDCEDKKIDIVFIDASHDFDLNTQTFLKIKESLSESAMIIVHDTGLWNQSLLTDNHKDVLRIIKHKVLENGIAHQIDERRFVNWITENHKEFTPLHLHSMNILRHGITLLTNQKKTLDT